MVPFHALYTFVSNLRSIFNSRLYSDQTITLNLLETMQRTINPISIEFDALNYTFFIKIKKTNMNKTKGFSNTPEYYYNNFIIPVFLEFMNSYRDQILGVGVDPFMFGMVLNNPSTLLNICHVTCLSDNIVSIKL